MLCRSILEYYDTVTEACQMCRNICPMAKEFDSFCVFNCAAYVNSIIGSASETTSSSGTDSAGSQPSHEQAWLLIAILTGGVAAIAMVIAIIVTVIQCRKWRRNEAKKFESADVTEDSKSLMKLHFNQCQDQDAEACKLNTLDSLSRVVVHHSPHSHTGSLQRTPHITPLSSSWSMLPINSIHQTSGATPGVYSSRLIQNCIQTRLVDYCAADDNTRREIKEGYEDAPDVCLLRSGGEHDRSEPASICFPHICSPDSDCEPEYQAQSSLTSMTDKKFEMIGWLNRQPWVLQYVEGENGVLEIAIDPSQISRSDAERNISRCSKEFCRSFLFRIIEPTRGRFVHCPGPVYSTMTQDLLSISPGVQLLSDQIEPDQGKKSPQKGYALFSGTVGQPGTSTTYGLTVGHLFEHELVGCKFQGVTIGKCKRKISDVVLGNRLGLATADLGLIELEAGCYPVHNIVNISGHKYGLSLFCGKLDASVSRPIDVIMLNQSGEVKRGKIISATYTMKPQGINNTLAIVDCFDQNLKINGEGDSGALIMSVPVAWKNGATTQRVPSPDADRLEELTVYGMVLGYYESDDKRVTRTIASRLGDILLMQSELFGSNDVNFVPVVYQSEGSSECASAYAVQATCDSFHELQASSDSAYATGFK